LRRGWCCCTNAHIRRERTARRLLRMARFIVIVIARNGMLGIIDSSSRMRRTLNSNRLPALGVPARRHAPSLNCGHARFQSAAVFVDQPRRAAKSLSR
jgi:hypothetical protein